jgi:hypothetical protein
MLKIAPPIPAPPPLVWLEPPCWAPPVSVRSSSASDATPVAGETKSSVSVSCGSAPTKNRRKTGVPAALERSSVAPLPSIVIGEAIAGRPLGPYQ